MYFPSHFSHSPFLKKNIFSLSEIYLFPGSERKGWSQSRFANVFLITESAGEEKYVNIFYYPALNI